MMIYQTTFITNNTESFIQAASRFLITKKTIHFISSHTRKPRITIPQDNPRKKASPRKKRARPARPGQYSFPGLRGFLDNFRPFACPPSELRACA